jgi:hypothetical protein
VKIRKPKSKAPLCKRTGLPKQKPGPKKEIGGKPVNFLPGEKLMKDLHVFTEEFKKLTGMKIANSFVFRNGAMMFMSAMRSQLKLATEGRLSAKRRLSLQELAKAARNRKDKLAVLA